MKFLLLPFTIAAFLPAGILALDPGPKQCDQCGESEISENDLGSITTITFCSESYEELDPSSEEIDRYEIFAVGDELGTCFEDIAYPKPIGKINGLDPFFGQTYFEIAEEQFALLREEDADVVLEFSVWANGGEGDCDEGAKLAEFTTEISRLSSGYNSNYDNLIRNVVQDYRAPSDEIGRVNEIFGSTSEVPYLTGSDVAQGTFQLSDEAQEKLFVQGNNGLGLYFSESSGDSDDSDGQLRLCTRVEYKVNYKGVDDVKETVSVLDTNYIIDIDLTADFSSFTDAQVQIFKRDPTGLNTEVSAEVDVEAYLCDSDSEPNTDPIKFTDGQDFRICVKPASDDAYSVSGFESITCSNSGETRLIVVGGNEDVLTTVDDSPARDGSLGFTSVVTSGFLSLDDSAAVPTDFKCAGEVRLAVGGRGGRRGLIAKSDFSSFTKTSNDNNNNNFNSVVVNGRKMQDNEAPPVAEDAPFAVAIELADPSDESSSPSYGPLLGLYYMAIFGAVAALL